jgi:hypothetical protein
MPKKVTKPKAKIQPVPTIASVTHESLTIAIQELEKIISSYCPAPIKDKLMEECKGLRTILDAALNGNTHTRASVHERLSKQR